MLTAVPELRALEEKGSVISVAIAGAGFVGRALVHQINLTPGMTASVVVSRRLDRGVAAFADTGTAPADIQICSDAREVAQALSRGARAVVSEPWLLRDVSGIDVVVDATGDVEFGALLATSSLLAGQDVVSLNFETDATVGPILAHLAEGLGRVYGGSDGDQPGVLTRLISYVEGLGLEVAAAVNCKGFLDVHANPDTIRPWAEKQGTSLKMTTAFTDGTKMQIENCSVANATGMTVVKRGMVGVETTLAEAVGAFSEILGDEPVVEYTLGGDFGSGVFVIGRGADPAFQAPYLKYLKMGGGPDYMFFRPWHLVQFETPLSIAETVLHRRPTIKPAGAPVTQVVTVAKREIEAGETLGPIGGYDHYGLVDDSSESSELLPVGLAEGSVVTSRVERDQPIPLDAVSVDRTKPLTKLLDLQRSVFDGNDDIDVAVEAQRLLTK